MKKKFKFIWIDDLPTRESAAKNLGKAMDASVDFMNVKGKDLEKKIHELLKANEPDLIVIDHKLQDISDGSFKTGSTAANIIRETWQACPIVCVSGVPITDFTLVHKDIYDAIFTDGRVSDNYQTILSIAKSYARFKKNRPKTEDDLMKMLGVPEDDCERLKSVLPSQIKENLSDSGVIRHISDWVRNLLFQRPGFLYDSLWAATFVGLNEKGFQKVSKTFDAARYSGLFADASKPLWWKQELLNITTHKTDVAGLPWEKGRKLKGMAKGDFSICYVTKEPYPETVAFTDDYHRERYAMKIKETMPDETFQDLLYFEELRKMTPAQ